MKPERANEILQECRRKPLVGSLSLLNCAEVDAILAACAEERKAALTEAAEACIRDSSEEYFAERILALRDQPKE